MRYLTLAAAALSLCAPLAHAACAPEPPRFQRHGEIVLSDPIAGENYEVASDGHVFETTSGKLRMIYAGDQDGAASIKLARGQSLTEWATARTLLGPSDGPPEARFKETPFYRLSESGEHQIYFIGYGNEETYRAQVYLATAPRLTGPYTVRPEPVIPRGRIEGKRVYLITSPSVMAHNGRLFMAFLGWNGFEDVTRVRVFGAVSRDDGKTWRNLREVPVPIGMEGQITRTPSGSFEAVRTSEHEDGEALFYACAEHPFGPYEDAPAPILTPRGKLERDEIIAPSLFYPAGSDKPHLFYTGADNRRGWWMLLANPRGE